jgi:ketosteroid isomerase-like protein
MNVPAGTLVMTRRAAGRELPSWAADFYAAYVSRKIEMLVPLLHEDVEWLIAGPADQFDHFGWRRGRKAVIELITRVMPCYFTPTGFEFEHLLVQGDAAAGFVAAQGRMRARQRESGRPLNFRVAHFLRFENSQLKSFRSVPDTFDAAEQIVGHPIDVTKKIESMIVASENVFLQV